MKIFLDTANSEMIQKYAQTGVIDGVTTNPSNLSKESGDPKKIVTEIARLLPHGHISVEVTKRAPREVYQQAQEIARLAPNIWVKIPCHADYYEVIKRLVDEEVKLNITLVFTLLQSLMICKLGVYYISPFMGRLGDIDSDGSLAITEIKQMVEEYQFTTKVLAASIRSVQDFHDAVCAGVDAVTLPIGVFEKAIAHPLTEKGIEQFAADWQKLGVNHFP